MLLCCRHAGGASAGCYSRLRTLSPVKWPPCLGFAEASVDCCSISLHMGPPGTCTVVDIAAVEGPLGACCLWGLRWGHIVVQWWWSWWWCGQSRASLLQVCASGRVVVPVLCRSRAVLLHFHSTGGLIHCVLCPGCHSHVVDAFVSLVLLLGQSQLNAATRIIDSPGGLL